MMWLILSAWVMGFVGSVHCIGMCGPLAMSLPMHQQTVVEKLFSALVYNLGRITTYAFYGSLIGLTKHFLFPDQFKNYLSISIGVLLLAMSLFFFIFKNKRIKVLQQNWFYSSVVNQLARMYQRNTWYNIFAIGLLNGLLPCGLVYVALASAFATGSVVNSILFMSFFGLGTLPAMWSMVFFAHYFSPFLRKNLQKVYPFVYIITGFLLIVRGLSDTNPLHDIVHFACKK